MQQLENWKFWRNFASNSSSRWRKYRINSLESWRTLHFVCPIIFWLIVCIHFKFKQKTYLDSWFFFLFFNKLRRKDLNPSYAQRKNKTLTLSHITLITIEIIILWPIVKSFICIKMYINILRFDNWLKERGFLSS